MHHRTKFHQNRSNGCRDSAFNVFFQNGGRPLLHCDLGSLSGVVMTRVDHYGSLTSVNRGVGEWVKLSAHVK